MNRNSKRKVFAATSAVCGLLAVGGIGLSTYAAYTVASNTYNYVTTPAFGADIVENYVQPPDGVYPGQDVTKEVSVSNTGTTPELVRISLEKRIGHLGEDGNVVNDESLDLDKMILNTDTESWELRDDGWYYYKDVLEPGGETTKLLKSFSLEEGLTDDYQSLDCQIVVNAETIQFGGGSEAVWGIDLADIGLQWTDGDYEDTETSVNFLGESEKFDIEVAKTDLFANFKDVLPGSTRSQVIQVTNSSKDTVTIGLDAMELDLEEKRIQGDSEQVRALMMDYATAKVSDADGNVVYDGPVGGQGECDIDLGEFAPGESKALHVSLSVSPDMDADAQSLMGSVSWEFSAAMADKPEEPVKQWLTKTSDLGLLRWGILLTIAGCVGTIVSKVWERLSNRNSDHASYRKGRAVR